MPGPAAGRCPSQEGRGVGLADSLHNMQCACTGMHQASLHKPSITQVPSLTGMQTCCSYKTRPKNADCTHYAPLNLTHNGTAQLIRGTRHAVHTKHLFDKTARKQGHHLQSRGSPGQRLRGPRHTSLLICWQDLMLLPWPGPAYSCLFLAAPALPCLVLQPRWAHLMNT
jgi:hypothetical protein